MIAMMQQINEANFGGRQMVTMQYTMFIAAYQSRRMPSIISLYACRRPTTGRSDYAGAGAANGGFDHRQVHRRRRWCAEGGGADQFHRHGHLPRLRRSEDTPIEIAVNANGQIQPSAHPASDRTSRSSDGRRRMAGLSADRQAVPADCHDRPGARWHQAAGAALLPAQIKGALATGARFRHRDR